jgi:hypothetical protein
MDYHQSPQSLADFAEVTYLTEILELEENMGVTAPASEVQKNFGAYHDRALVEPVRVTKYGRETVYIVSATTFHQLKQSQRRALGAGELTDAEMAAIESAEIPAEHRYTLRNTE